MITIEREINNLIELGAGKFEHLNGSLLNHLKGTYMLLKSWGAESALCVAGMYHAVYGTSGFDEVIISGDDRDKIKRIIGEESEKIVYSYCACDRDFFWSQIGVKTDPIFRDRFLGKEYFLSSNELKLFCELTVANELEIAKGNHEFIEKYGRPLNDLFQRMKPYICLQANMDAIEMFGKCY
jgi:hypothetical protein